MNTTRILAVGITSLVCAFAATAQTYQWKNSQGQTVISDTPPPGNAKSARTVGANQPLQRGELDSSKPSDAQEKAAAPKSTAEKDMDFKKRQQETKEKAEKEAKEQAAARDKQENCDRARRNLAALEANQPMATLDEKGERIVMDNSQREQEMERARRFMAESCK